jgi:hypothetical protein
MVKEYLRMVVTGRGELSVVDSMSHSMRNCLGAYIYAMFVAKPACTQRTR